MSFNPFAPESAIITRLKSHVALVTATQGIYNTVAPDDITVARGADPFVVMTHISGETDDTFEGNVGRSLYQVSVFDHRSNSTNNAKTVVGYIIGDSEGTDNAPTYGLHRWKISGVTDMGDALMRWVRYGTQHDESTWHYFIEFEVYVPEA